MSKYTASSEQQLFDLLDSTGEGFTGELHIIKCVDLPYEEDEIQYRVYSSDGYCFDVYRKIEDVDEEKDEVSKYDYEFYQEWDGFKKFKSVEEAYSYTLSQVK